MSGLQNYIGIIGTVAGSISTLIITYILKRIGNLHFYLFQYAYLFHKSEYNKYNGDYFKVNYEIDVYNSSEENKILRNFNLVFYNNDKILYSTIPNDEDTYQSYSAFSNINKASIVLIKAKETSRIDQSICINKDIDDFLNCNKIKLHYNVNNSKRIKKFIISKEKIKITDK